VRVNVKFINEIDLAELSKKFITNKPFPHVIIDNFLTESLASKLYEEFPSHNDSFWHEYANPLEKKLACNVKEYFPPTIGNVLDFFNSSDCRKIFEQITQILDLQNDPGLHGAGMHCIKRGGKLDVHLDYAIHPVLKLERRLNLILYLNKDWNPTWGGQLELWNSDMTEMVKSVDPIFNRAVIFDTSDGSYHGHPDPLVCPENQSRKSLAVYYLTEPRPNVKERYRALFVARPSDDKSIEMEKFRELRAGLDTGQSLHKSSK
jgi:Rps23 Pro-64 3,4-dihydroxylase Tpa1-like proline 4-hydroxylase